MWNIADVAKKEKRLHNYIKKQKYGNQKSGDV